MGTLRKPRKFASWYNTHNNSLFERQQLFNKIHVLELTPNYWNFADINECESGELLCELGCQNQIGSYICTCDEGYQIDEDGRTCVGWWCKIIMSCYNWNLFCVFLLSCYVNSCICIFDMKTKHCKVPKKVTKIISIMVKLRNRPRFFFS